MNGQAVECGHEELVAAAIDWESKLEAIQRDPRDVTPETLADSFTRLVTEIRRLKEAH